MENASALTIQERCRQIMMKWRAETDRHMVQNMAPVFLTSLPFPSIWCLCNIMSSVSYTQTARHQTRHSRQSVGERVILTKVWCLPIFRCQDWTNGTWELHISYESFSFLIKSCEERRKEHDTSSLRGCDPDKHVYALGCSVSEFNKKLL